MRFAKCSTLLVSLFITGCSKSVPESVNPPLAIAQEPQANNGTEITELKRRNEELASRVRELEEQNASIDSARVLLERERQARIVEIAKLTEASENAMKTLASLESRSAQVDSQYQQAANNFARLGELEKHLAIQALQKMKTTGPGSVNRHERDIVAQVGTPETIRLVNEWDMIEAKKFGFDENGGTFAGKKPLAIEDNTPAKPDVPTPDIPKLIASKRKSMKDIRTKGLAIKRQLSAMEGNETPAALKKFADLEKQFDDLKTEYDKLAAEADALERESKGEMPKDGYDNGGYGGLPR
jgi:chromosome segregation ATPase